jgi:hypothetical protein
MVRPIAETCGQTLIMLRQRPSEGTIQGCLEFALALLISKPRSLVSRSSVCFRR